jgi:hypothetical protein
MNRTLITLLGCAAGVLQAQVAEMPMQLEKNIPLVQVRLNGSAPLWFILDSAAAELVLDSGRAQELGLTPSGEAISSGSGGEQVTGLVEGVTADFGGAKIQTQRALTFNLAALKFEHKVEGIIGFPLFGSYVVEIDYPKSKVRIWNKEEYRVPANAKVLKMSTTSGPVVRGSLKVKGKAPLEVNVQLDTGSAHVLTVVTPFVDREGLLGAAEELKPGQTLGFGGNAPDMVGRIEEVIVGPMVAEHPEVRLSRQTVGGFGSEESYQANAGGKLFKGYRLTFDLAGGRLMVEQPGI